MAPPATEKAKSNTQEDLVDNANADQAGRRHPCWRTDKPLSNKNYRTGAPEDTSEYEKCKGWPA